MQKVDYIIPRDMEPYVNCIMVDECSGADSETEIPIYADGYPGIMFQQSANGFYQQPRNKKLSELFLFGQTITPFTLNAEGPFNFVVVQLYPFASKYLLNIDSRELNDDCYDLMKLQKESVREFHQQLCNAGSLEEKVDIIYQLIADLIRAHEIPEDDMVQRGIELILDTNGQMRVADIVQRLYTTERTFERNFLAEIGLTPKQFSKIIQFQSSLSHLNQSSFRKLTEISHDSGFTDQSHFIRTFKKYTGQTPSYYLQQTLS